MLIARYHIHAGKTGLAKDHCEKGLDNFDLWPPTSEAASVARLSMAQRGCVAELLYLLTTCLSSTPPCQQYIAQSWLQTPASSQPSSEQLPSPEDTPPVAKRQSRRPPSTSKTRKPAATGKRRTSKSAVSMALSATASQSATSSSSTATGVSLKGVAHSHYIINNFDFHRSLLCGHGQFIVSSSQIGKILVYW